MTGYAYSEKSFDGAVVSVEIKSVNSRFLDVFVNLPPFLNPLESALRSKITEKLVRGKVDVNVRVKELESDSEVVADSNAALSYLDAIKKVASACGYADGQIPLSLVISQNGVLNLSRNYDVEKYRLLIEPVFMESLEKFIEDRKREGENLRKDLEEKLSVLVACADFFCEWQPRMDELFRDLVKAKFTELLGSSVDENRVMTEVAAMIVKYTINEEVVRLKSHLAAMKTEISENPAPGKRLDFICQEMNREINTIGSKNQFSEVGAMVINAKDALENIREQSKNVE